MRKFVEGLQHVEVDRYEKQLTAYIVKLIELILQKWKANCSKNEYRILRYISDSGRRNCLDNTIIILHKS
jgi:hypothetical protein